jgi:hypothetical protein
VAENRVLTGAAIVILLVAVALGWLARYQASRDARASAEDGEEGEGSEGDEAPERW